ncbi:alpha/beta hydrolase [Sphingomonas sp. MMSM20]|uniref:alpha/beta fold hydrolase n=1 Tax=Sphingomonas lycopersici TaxID=2951807 RepID=UPI0015CA42C1|nr:alpha/beta fold hydrolase [Sphingomonas lycopersici]MCW6532657.1 alpha/beta hydrolase [Sphingomonas lycopersici]
MSRLPIVLASGQLLTEETWTPQRAAWADRDVHHADHTRDETIAGMATRLLAAAPERFALVAHAMGGFVAFEVMRRAPERVARLALIATLPAADGPAQTARRQGYIDLVDAGRFDQVIEERIPMLFPPAKRDDAPLLALARRMAAQTGAETFLRQQRAIMSRIDSRPTLGAITAPVLLIRGDADGITTAEQQQEMLDGIPGAHLEILPGVGHLPTIEAAGQTTALLTDWLDRA